MTWNDFPPHVKIETAAADTEAFVLVDGVRVSTAEMEALATEKTAAWWRQHVSVEVYAWLISDGQKTACFPTWEAFAAFCAEHKVSCVWWYNAKYDFAHIDYAVLTSNWRLKTSGKLGDHEYKSLHGSQGQRYSFAFGLQYVNQSRHKRVHLTRCYDLCNIFGGGLDKNLKAFDVRDFDGNPVRKLEMDYQNADDPNARAYMDNDVIGLYHLVRTCDAFLTGKWGYTLMKKPDVMTAGGLAKRVLLSYYNGFSKDHKSNVKEFQRWHKIDLSADNFYRKHGLYRGGITIVNPAHQNKPITGKIYKYDINSMYPNQMHKMPDLVGRPYFVTLDEWVKKWKPTGQYTAAFMLRSMRAVLRPNMFPTWYDRLNKKYVSRGTQEEHDTPTLMFECEFDELRNWYDIDEYNTKIDGVYMWQNAPAHAFRQFVDDNYEMKREGKRTGNKVMEAFAKLLLNSSYGKLAENPYKDQTHREINPETGAVTLVDDGETTDENCLLSVVLGAYITARARVQLLSLIRDVCPVPARDFLYCDTDSIAATTRYDKCDPYTLGELKDETEINGSPCPYTWAKYIAPKTYILVRTLPNGKRDVECHCKGMPLKSIFSPVSATEARAVGKISPEMENDEINTIFAAGRQFVALAGMNVRGGKALVPVLKYLCREDNTIMDGSNNDPENMTLLIER